MEMYIDLAVKYLPLLLLLLGVIIGGIKGLLRGAHKSMVLLVHASVTFAICLIIFVVCVNFEATDKFLLDIINSILKPYYKDLKEDELVIQYLLDVSQENETFRQCMLEFIPKNMNFIDGLELILKENGAYLSTLVDLVYKLVFGIVCWVLHIVLTIISHILYWIFWPESKYRKKTIRLHENNMLEYSYRKRRWLGAMIGGARSFVKGLVFLSFLGSLFFIVSGGKGDEEMPELDFGNDNINLIYSAYSSISEYGTEGIYKILNAIDDPNEVPYYLFAADVIFSGGINDVNNGIRGNVHFREELAAYVGFAKDTLKLVIKYGGEDVEKVIQGGFENEATMDLVMQVIGNYKFQEEFTDVITSFDAKTYFINLSLSLADSFVRHLDQTGLVGDLGDAQEIMNIAFKPGYLSERIPYEKELKDSLDDDEEIVLDYINASSIITEGDIVEVLNVFYSYINIYQNLDAEAMGVELIKAIIPRIKNLSIFDSNDDALNGVLRRIYAYVDYVYLTEPYLENINSSEVLSLQKDRYYISKEYESINWINELSSIIEVVDDVWYIYEECFVETEDILKSIFSIFEDSETVHHLDEVIQTVYESKILGEVLSSQFIYMSIEQSLAALIPGVHISKDISYSDVYDEHGNLVKKGELYYVLTSIKALGSSEESRKSIESLINLDPEAGISQTIQTVMNLLNCKTESGDVLSNHLINSQLIQSILSGFLLNIEIDTGVKLLYVSEDILQKDSNGEAINVITKDEFVNFFGVMEPFIEIVMPFIEGNFDPENMINEVFGLLRDERINQIIDCKLIEGTLSNLLVSFLKDNGLIIIPQEMKNGVGMVSTPDKDSEIKLLCNVFRNTNIDISGLIGSENIMGELSKINEQELELLLTSGILHHTVSNFIYADRRNLIADFALVVPNSVMKDGVIEKNSIISFLDIILDLLPNENEEFDSNLLVDKIRNNTNTYLSNEIMSATLSYAFVNNQSIKDSLGDILIVPTSLKTPALNIDTFESGFANTGWKEELLDLFTSFDILIGSDDINSLSNNIVQTVLSLNEYYDYYNKITKLQKIYESNIMSASISNQLDMQIIDNNIVSDDIAVTNRVLASAHDNSGCFKFEEVEALLDSFVIFGITASGNNISINPEELIKNITGDLMNYNNPCEAIERYNTLPLDMRPSTLDIIYGSAVIRSLVSEKLREILSDSNGLGLTEQYNKILVDEFDNYKKEEVKALIKLLEILEISGDSLTSDDSKESINAKLSDGISKIRENLDSLYDGSKMVGVIIHKKLQDNGFRVPTSSGIAVDGDFINAVSLDEATKLFNVMDEIGIGFNGDYNIEDFDIDNINVSSIYQSGIIKYYISDLLEDKLLALGVLPTVGYDAMKSKFKTIDKKDLNCTDGYFNESELTELLTFLEDVLGISLNNTSLDDPNVYIHKIAGTSLEATENRKALENSFLTRAIISHQIFNFIEGSSNFFLVDSNLAHEKNGDVVIRILRYSEIDSLLGMIEGDLTDYNPDTISLSNIKDLVASDNEGNLNSKSYILNASISEELIGSGTVIQIPESVYDEDNSIIHPYHLGLLIDALIALVGDNGVHFESFDEFNVPDTEEQFEIIAKSVIMRASISYNLKISDDNAILGVVNDPRYGEIVKNTYGNNILLLNQNETVNIFKAINALFNDEDNKTFNISIEKVMSSANVEVFNSNLLCVAASTYLNSKGIIGVIELVTNKSPEVLDVIKCNGSIIQDVLVFTTEDIVYVLERCQDIINGSY